MAAELFEGEDSGAGPQSMADSKEFKNTAKTLNANGAATSSKRDLLDSILTFVNKDLLICKLFYFFFFGAFGSLFPLMAIYFKQLGMNASQGGVLIGFRPFIEFLSAPFWGGVADKWKKGKELLLFSIFCWIIFTLSIAFVKPPAHRCLKTNGTHTLMEKPKVKRSLEPELPWIYPDFESPASTSGKHTASLGAAGIPVRYFSPNHVSGDEDVVVLLPIAGKRGVGKAPLKLDHNRIANVNQSDVEGLINPPYSSIIYREDEVQSVFFILLLLIVIGEFFSAPAITFADSVTLACLGEDVQNYGRQRMFGSLGWALSMFFVGLALDHSTTFPQHPCGNPYVEEKNYVVCFAVFSVLMSCAFITALQFRFDHHGPGKEFQLAHITEKVKDKVKKTLSGVKRIDRERLVEDDEDFLARHGVTPDWQQQQQQQQQQPQQQPQQQQQPVVTAADGEKADDQEKSLHISLEKREDMVSDVTRPIGAPPAEGTVDNLEEPFLGKWWAVLKLLGTYQYISVLFIAWFMGFGIGVIFTFLFWHLQDLGGSPTLFGVASVINHVSELLAYFMSAKFIASFGHVKVLYAGLLGNVARFMYISWLTNPWWVLPFEFVQGLTHAAVWAAVCAFICQAIPTALRTSAQGILQGLHHGLGRGCGAVFGGIMVYQYGSEVTFRAYGVACVIVLVIYLAVNFFLEDRGYFSHGSTMSHAMLEESQVLAPHGVPAGMARDLSSHRLDMANASGDLSYGSTYEGKNTLMDPWAGVRGVHNGNSKTESDDKQSQPGYQSAAPTKELTQQPPQQEQTPATAQQGAPKPRERGMLKDRKDRRRSKHEKSPEEMAREQGLYQSYDQDIGNDLDMDYTAALQRGMRSASIDQPRQGSIDAPPPRGGERDRDRGDRGDRERERRDNRERERDRAEVRTQYRQDSDPRQQSRDRDYRQDFSSISGGGGSYDPGYGSQQREYHQQEDSWGGGGGGRGGADSQRRYQDDYQQDTRFRRSTQEGDSRRQSQRSSRRHSSDRRDQSPDPYEQGPAQGNYEGLYGP